MKVVAIAVAGVFAVCSAQSAYAAQYLITYTGTVKEGLDRTDIWGFGHDADISGKEFTAKITLTAPREGALYTAASGVSTYSGSGLSNPISIQLSIGQGNYLFSESYGIVLKADNDAILGLDRLNIATAETIGAWTLSLAVQGIRDFVYSLDFNEELDYTVPSDFIPDPNYHPGPPVQPNFIDASGFFRIPAGPGEDIQSGGNLVVTRLTMSRVETGPVVPEPATWAMMLAGFGAVGYALRRRRLTKLSPQTV